MEPYAMYRTGDERALPDGSTVTLALVALASGLQRSTRNYRFHFALFSQYSVIDRSVRDSCRFNFERQVMVYRLLFASFSLYRKKAIGGHYLSYVKECNDKPL